MKEATGELNMTLITIVAIAAIGGILALMWPQIRNTIMGTWTSPQTCPTGQYWDSQSNSCH